LISSDVLFGKYKTYLSTRPYKLDQLLKGIDRQGSDSRKFHVIEIHPFKLDELPVFFKGYYNRVKPLIDKLKQRQEQGINLIQLPLFARLVKIMAIKGRFQQPETIADANRSSLMRQFIDFVVDEQSEKDKIPAQDKEEKRTNYEVMMQKIEQLSLKTLEVGQIYTFDKEYAQDILGDESFRRNWPLMKRIEFIDKFIDYESKESLAEPKHRFQHQIFQEYFAAIELCRLYRKAEEKPDRPEMRAAMEKMKYMPEVGQFFAELIEEKSRAEEFDFWQDLVTRNNREDWVRTYALQVRDKLGEHKAKDALSKLFDAENRRLAQSNHSSPMVHVPEGGFVRGSYEFEDEWSVSWVAVDNFDIDRHPVTNRQFMEFLKDHHKRNKSYKDTDDQEVIDFEFSKIKAMAEEVIIQEGYEDHPLVGVTWHGAQAYCKWKSSLEQAEFRLPTEAEWEKAARGSLGRRYPWGNEFAGEKCNTSGSEIDYTSRIGSFPDGRSPYGCHDMAGNVWEWCQDDYQSDFYEKGSKVNPVCTKAEELVKVLRGGSSILYRDFARCALRNWNIPEYRLNDVGFRCAWTKK
jgi:formylglycine-generating enzyme required for sulfatase activity